MLSATDALRQAHMTALTYFDMIREEIDKAYPKASPDARLSAVVELCKVAAMDYNSVVMSGNVTNTPQSAALTAIGEISEVGRAIVEAIESKE